MLILFGIFSIVDMSLDTQANIVFNLLKQIDIFGVHDDIFKRTTERHF
jgi:hypothetical protein